MIEYSVIIPTYKGFKRLSIVLNSLCRQSVAKEKIEVIVVNDGSPGLSKNAIDSLCRFYAELNLRVLHMPVNRGPAAARNFGVANSIGKIIFFTDDDCEIPALWMETHLNIYRDHSEISAIGGWYTFPLYMQRQNIYALFLELRSQIVFYPFLYQAMDSNLFAERNERMPEAHLAFAAGNTANFSIKRLVAAKVKFDERFIAPGYEDSFYATSIQKAGFIVYSIPFFVYNLKAMTLKNFIKTAISRGLGLYVFNRLMSLNTPFGQRMMRRKFIRYVKCKATTSPLIRGKKIALIFLVYIYFFIVTYFDFWYGRIYQRKRGVSL